MAAIAWTPLVIAYMAISGEWESTAAVKAPNGATESFFALANRE